ncbi:MAG TPA: hypothetical protein VFE17_03670 [Candidatus Baltobacteraceae bacterium]|jgi:hypothetical protein|nr:hypothetical protein [Candidatus Baltobacteraceae bacterium]
MERTTNEYDADAIGGRAGEQDDERQYEQPDSTGTPDDDDDDDDDEGEDEGDGSPGLANESDFGTE